MQWPFLINAFYAREVIMPPQPQVRRYMACDCHATFCNNMIDTKNHFSISSSTRSIRLSGINQITATRV
jgi:hypothetical protein